MQFVKWSLFIATMGLVVWSCGQPKNVVATVGDKQITVDEFKSSFQERFRTEENVLKRTLEERKQFIRELAVAESKYQEGLARGYDKIPEISEQVENIARRKALDLLYEKRVVEPVVTPAAVKEFYDMSAYEKRARHILLKKSPTDTTAADDAKLHARIDSIKSVITGGMSFGEAAVKFSEDNTTAPDSGDLEWFGWGRMVDEFQRAVWSAKSGELVGPVKTPFGYHLISVDSSRTVEGRRSFEEMKPEIEARLKEVEGQKLADTAKNFVDGLRSGNQLEYKDDVLTEFVNRIQDPTLTKKGALDPFFTEEQKNKVAATYNGGQVTLNDMIQKVGENAWRVDWSSHQTSLDLVNAIVEPILLEKAAEDDGLYKIALNDPEITEQKRTAIVRHIDKVEVTDKISPTDEEEQNYYRTHLDNFIQAEQREIREIFIKADSTKAARVHARAAVGENFTKLAQQFNEKESTKNDTGRVGPFEEKRFGMIGKTAFKLGKEGDVSDPVKIGENWSVVKLLKIIPSRTKTWEESAQQARREFRIDKTAVLQKQLDESMVEKYKLTINDEVLTSVWPLPEGQQGTIAREP